MAFPTITVRVAFGSDSFAASPSWTDISSFVMNFNTRRGRKNDLERVDAGTAHLEIRNTGGEFWPGNTLSPYYPNVKPGKRINIRATYNAVTYDVFTGFVESWLYESRVSEGGSGNRGSVVVITAVDLFKNLSYRLLNDGTGYPQQRVDQRITEVLDDLGWADRTLDTANSSMIATGPLVDVNAMDHLRKAAEAEMGVIFVRPNGDVKFQERHARLKAPFITSQGIYGDDPGELEYRRPKLEFDDRLVYNDIRITREGGAEQVAEDATSQATWGQRSYQRTGLLVATDNEAFDQAHYVLRRYKDPFLHIPVIEVAPMRNETQLFPDVLGFDISDRITFRMDDSGIDRDFHIESVEHDVEGKGFWTTRWYVTPVEGQGYWILDVSRLDIETIPSY